ncbi:MAG: TldD/PmbA family protein, partial [Proteobacteria bacterium]
MLDSRTAQDVISAGCDLGASFVDIYVERTVYEAITMRDSEVKDIKTGTDFGIGIRAIFGHKSVYGYTNIAEKEELLRILRLICEMDKTSKKSGPKSFNPEKIAAQMRIERGLDKPSPYEEKIAFLRSVDKAVRKNEKVTQFDGLSMQKWQTIQVFDSEGLSIEDERHALRIPMTVITSDGSKQARSFLGPGGSRGWELTKEIQVDEVAETLVKRALTVLHADACPAGKMPVVIDNGFGGVIFHEACGHLLETTSVEKKASVFHDKMGEMIASPVVSAVDDGT